MCAGVKQKNGSSRRVLLLERLLPLGRQTTGKNLCLTPLTSSPGSGNQISSINTNENRVKFASGRKNFLLIAALDVNRRGWLAVTGIEIRKNGTGQGRKEKEKTGAFSPEI